MQPGNILCRIHRGQCMSKCNNRPGALNAALIDDPLGYTINHWAMVNDTRVG